MLTNGAYSTANTPDTLGKENELPSQRRRLSRSPHPYHKNKSFLSNLTPINSATIEREDATESTRVLDPTSSLRPVGTTYFDTDSRTRRKSTTSPSNSGTEADDESGVFLKGLPAPHVRQRKGLKGPSATSSPLFTPSYLDDENRRLVVERQSRRRRSLQSPIVTDEETVKIREKFTRRRRAELLRRVTETLLLGSVACISCVSVPRALLRRWAKGSSVKYITKRGEAKNLW